MIVVGMLAGTSLLAFGAQELLRRIREGRTEKKEQHEMPDPGHA